MGKQKELSQRQLLAIQALMEGSTKVDALRIAGYAESSASKQQTVFFDQPMVRKELERRRALTAKKFDLTEDWVIERLMRIADSGAILAKFKKVTKDGGLKWNFTDATEEELAAINELTVTTTARGSGKGRIETTKFKVGSSDPKGALDSLARKLGLFNDSIDIKGGISLTDRIAAGRDRISGKGNEDGETEPA